MYIPYKLRFINRKLRLLKQHLFKHWEGEKILKESYRSFYSNELNLIRPQEFSDKMFHQMIQTHRYGNPLFTKLADKYLVRDYVSSKVGSDYLIDLLWYGTNPEKIPFDNLPSKCVVKTNHGSGGNIIMQEPYDRKEIVATLKNWLKENYYYTDREYHYFKIKRQVLVEEFIDDGFSDGPLDYRFWCFNGRPEFIQVDNHSHSINPFYNVDWNKLQLSYRDSFTDCDIKQPENLNEMLTVAAKLSSDFDFVRVDLYNVSGKIYFGELTFTPCGGKFKFKPDTWDALLGKKWILNKNIFGYSAYE